MQLELPIKCACGGVNSVWEDFITNRLIIVCECGTKLTIDKEQWFSFYGPSNAYSKETRCK